MTNSKVIATDVDTDIYSDGIYSVQGVDAVLIPLNLSVLLTAYGSAAAPSPSEPPLGSTPLGAPSSRGPMGYMTPGETLSPSPSPSGPLPSSILYPPGVLPPGSSLGSSPALSPGSGLSGSSSAYGTSSPGQSTGTDGASASSPSTSGAALQLQAGVLLLCFLLASILFC
eukprot:TRINITY_DN3322_c0_g2_i3.p1 TRINITY_DN3322_c0_g2~~TRINITY_DN3322_c0_g2_i3.p1  ORF type:complete len:170 (-),score=20.41 TRINITY_DN3322_c0_g2_i3:131-640(-)